MPTSYRYRDRNNGRRLPTKPPKLVSGCLIPLAIFLIIILLSYLFGGES